MGYYAGGMSDGVRLTIHGSAGWGLAECLMSGTVVVDGNAGNGAAASIRGGTVVVRGDAAARAGVSMKGGLLVIGGGCGYMTGFMMQRGRIIVCGDAGDALADSMYEGVIYVGGEIAALGSDAVVSEASDAELAEIRATLARHGLDGAARIPEGRVRDASSGTTTRRTWRHGRRRSETAAPEPDLPPGRDGGHPRQGGAGPVPLPGLRHAPARGPCPASTT